MPIYGYRCGACHQETDVLQPIGSAAPKACPHCGEPALVRTPSLFGVHFKGGGFYTTDYARKEQQAPSTPTSSSPDLP